jgi:ribosomal protein L12E/L44/L45/RPP1/RPP2
MSDSANGAAAPATGAQDNQQFAESKGKGKAAQDTEMKETNTEEDDDDESDEAEEVSHTHHLKAPC